MAEPASDSASRFSAASLRADAVAGLTVTLVGLPQCLAYAMMSGLPPAYGLVTAAVPGLVAALVGKSAQVVTGPTNTTGLLILAALGPYLADNGLLGTSGLPVLATLTLMAGVVRIVAALAGGDKLLRFLPESVLVGFTAGAGILIAVMQLDEALGLRAVRGAGLFGEARGVISAFMEGNGPRWPALGVAAGTVILIGLGKRFVPRLPMALLCVIGAAAGAWALGLNAADGLPLVRDRSPLPTGWPPMALPSFDPSLLGSLLVPAAAISLLGTLELTVSARAEGDEPNMKREIQAQGWANVAGAFTGAFPASASLTRSALLRLGGATSRAAAGIAAVTMFPILLFGGSAGGFIPQASLAGVLFITAYGMIGRDTIRRMWMGARTTRVLLLGTAIATLVLPLEWAILLGVAFGLALHLARTSVPRIVVLHPVAGRLLPTTEDTQPETVILEVSGDLHYAAVPAFISEARRLIPPSAKLVVIDLSHAHEMRFAALKAFEQLSDELEQRDVTLRLAGVPLAFCEFVERVRSRLCVTPAELEPGASLHRCLQQPDDDTGATTTDADG